MDCMCQFNIGFIFHCAKNEFASVHLSLNRTQQWSSVIFPELMRFKRTSVLPVAIIIFSWCGMNRHSTRTSNTTSNPSTTINGMHYGSCSY